MQYRILGSTGVEVSRLCMGTMTFGREADPQASAAIYHRCREAGVNFFDCANGYAGGDSERILGELIAGQREEVVITSKAYFPVGEDRNARGLSRYHLLNSVEASLKRLNTDRIDVFFLHHWDDRTPIEEALRALDDLVRQGKILYPAASNFAAWQYAKALGISAKEGWSALKAIQPMYSLVKRQAEVEILPMARAENLGVISYSPLGGGLLTGKYAALETRAGRIVENTMYAARYSQEWAHHAARRFADLARDRGFHPAALAVAWVAAHPAVTAPIIGARNLEQLEPALGALDLDMTPELYAELCALTPAPPPATDRSEEVAA